MLGNSRASPFRYLDRHLLPLCRILQALDTLAENGFPGSVLIRLGFGTASEYKRNKGKWSSEVQGLLKREDYELRIHLYQVSWMWIALDVGQCGRSLVGTCLVLNGFARLLAGEEDQGKDGGWIHARKMRIPELDAGFNQACTSQRLNALMPQGHFRPWKAVVAFNRSRMEIQHACSSRLTTVHCIPCNCGHALPRPFTIKKEPRLLGVC